MSLKVTGKIEKVLEKQSGTSKSGKEWVKQSFIIRTNDEYNNLYCFELFGQEKVDNFDKYNKTGDIVDVEFNVNTNEYNDKYYTSLQAWKVFKSEIQQAAAKIDKEIPPAGLDEDHDDLPF